MTKKSRPHPIGFVVNTHPLIGGSAATLDPKRRRKAVAKRPPMRWKVDCPGCDFRSEWQAGENAELAAQTLAAGHKCAK